MPAARARCWITALYSTWTPSFSPVFWFRRLRGRAWLLASHGVARAGRSGCAGVADVGRQGHANRLEQRADDAGGGRAQGHLPPVFADRDLLEAIEVAQHVTPFGPKAHY